MKQLLLFSLVALTTILTSVDCYIRVCYYTNWSQYRNGVAKYSLKQHYQTGLCTHIIYSFGKVVMSGGGYVIAPYEWNDQSQLYGQLKALKGKDPNLKTLLAIGGWNHGSNGFTQMVKTKQSRKFFIEKSMEYVQEYGFDGLDLDWEYPAQRGSPREDRQLFSLLCEELAAAYNPRGLLVTAAVAAGTGSVDTSYEVAKISKSLDFINLMTYDLYGGWLSNSGHHTNTNENANPHNLHKTVKHWIGKGADASKLVLGLASYGRTFKLSSKCNWQIGSSTRGSGAPGPHTKEAGFMAYYEICNLKWVNHVCTKSSSVNAPYGSTVDRFVGYDDQESIVYKIENVMKAYNMKGYMFWALDLDDFSGSVCNQGRYPLMNAAMKASLGQRVNPPTCQNMKNCDGTIDPSVGTTVNPTTNGKCRSRGIWKSSSMDQWCSHELNCEIACTVPCKDQGVCDRCECNPTHTTKQPMTTTKKPKTTTTRPTTSTEKPTTEYPITTTEMPETTTERMTTTTKRPTTTTEMPNTTTEGPSTTTRPGPKKNCKPLKSIRNYWRYRSFCTHYCYRCDISKFFGKYCTCE